MPVTNVFRCGDNSSSNRGSEGSKQGIESGKDISVDNFVKNKKTISEKND